MHESAGVGVHVSAMEYSCHAGLSIVPAGLSPLTCRGSQDFVLGYFQSPFGLRRPGFGPGVFFFFVCGGGRPRPPLFLPLALFRGFLFRHLSSGREGTLGGHDFSRAAKPLPKESASAAEGLGG
jgi:hypothetical protein